MTDADPRTERTPPTAVDLLIDAWYVVTMNATRDIIRDGSVAVRDGAIVAVGKAADLERRYTATRRVGGDRFVVTPGMVNTHIHITGEPLTRGYVPDDTPFEENVFMWLCPLYARTPPEERLLGAARCRGDAAQSAPRRSSRPARSASSTR
jgi:5-methylthioadenosine/S-adenosylhomocysteine deaminase